MIRNTHFDFPNKSYVGISASHILPAPGQMRTSSPPCYANAYVRRLIVLAGLALAPACAPERVASPILTPPEQVSEDAVTIPPRQPGDSAAVDSVARAMALALSDATLRRQLHDDLRDSPFSRHRIHLWSYLRGARGRPLLTAMSQRSGYPEARISAIVGFRGGLQIGVPRAIDRVWWESPEPIVVEGTALTFAERSSAERKIRTPPLSSAAAYDAQGKVLAHSINTEATYPYLSIGPTTRSFGSDPENARSGAGHAARKTVSNFDEEMEIYRERGDSLVRAHPDSTPGMTVSLIVECPPDPTLECNGGGSLPPPRPMGVSIPSGKNYASCYRPGFFDTTVDRDRDGVDDQCEAELAVAFQPQLVFDIFDCETRRQPQFAVRQKVSPNWGGVILIFYAISYMYDCGIPIWGDNHLGDSEWIIEEVGPSADPSYGPWSLKYATLSAHWKSGNDNTAGYEARDLEDAVGSPGFGAPRIWASTGKHSNYRTRVVCNSAGFINWDSCDNPGDMNWTFLKPAGGLIPFGAGQNLGSTNVKFMGGPGLPIYNAITNTGTFEYFWPAGKFCGWLTPPPPLPGFDWCAESYYRGLTLYGY